MEQWENPPKEVIKKQSYTSVHNEKLKENIFSTLQESIFWKNFTVRNGNSIFTIKGQNPIINKEKKETITLDNDFPDLFPKKIDGLCLLTEEKKTIPLFPESLVKKFNLFLAGKSEIKDNLHHGNCIDFVYALMPWKWVAKNQNGELWTPNKKYFSPYKGQNIAHQPIIYYHQGERSHAALSLGNGICISRMGEGGDLLITTIDELKQVYGDEVWIKH